MACQKLMGKFLIYYIEYPNVNKNEMVGSARRNAHIFGKFDEGALDYEGPGNEESSKK